jgi:hypothetical protein
MPKAKEAGGWKQTAKGWELVEVTPPDEPKPKPKPKPATAKKK